jgi:hypothetical protein
MGFRLYRSVQLFHPEHNRVYACRNTRSEDRLRNLRLGCSLAQRAADVHTDAGYTLCCVNSHHDQLFFPAGELRHRHH